MGSKDRLIAEFGEQGYRELMAAWGSKGGKKRVAKGFSKLSKHNAIVAATKAARARWEKKIKEDTKDV